MIFPPCDRNRNGGSVACYLRKDLCFNKRALHCKKDWEYYFWYKLFAIGFFYRPPDQANYMELLIIKNVYVLNLKDNEIYLLSDFNINLLQNGN